MEIVMVTEAQITAAIKAWQNGSGSFRNVFRTVIEAADMAAWQPIETAPKDGTSILLFDPKQLIYVALGCWLGPIQEWSTGCWEHNVSPTHWCPTSEAVNQMLRSARPTES